MIYITGDCHSKFHKFSMKIFPEQKEMTKEDFVIIAGDFGGVWKYKGEDSEERNWKRISTKRCVQGWILRRPCLVF